MRQKVHSVQIYKESSILMEYSKFALINWVRVSQKSEVYIFHPYFWNGNVCGFDQFSLSF